MGRFVHKNKIMRLINKIFIKNISFSVGPIAQDALITKNEETAVFLLFFNLSIVFVLFRVNWSMNHYKNGILAIDSVKYLHTAHLFTFQLQKSEKQEK